MEDHELVSLTLDRLIDHFKLSPESFSYADTFSPSITWKPKVALNDFMNTEVDDPNNLHHAAVVIWNPINSELSAFLFLKDTSDLSLHKSDCSAKSQRMLERFRGNYRKFNKLKNLIIAREKHKESLVYLKKLSTVFPDALDKHFL